MTTWPVATLVQRARMGDEAAWRALYDHYDAPIRKYLGRWATGYEVEDLAQDVWVKAWQALPKANEDTERLFQAWLYRIATRRANDAYRHAKALQWLSWDEYVAAPCPAHVAPDDPEHVLLQLELREEVRAVLAQLPPRYRAVLVLDATVCLSQVQLGHVMGLAPMGVKKLRAQARQAYRAVLAGTFRPANYYAPFVMHAPLPLVSLARRRARPAGSITYRSASGQRPFQVRGLDHAHLGSFATREAAEGCLREYQAAHQQIRQAVAS